jgi:hypothetical protein
MRARVSTHLSYANVMATLAIFLVLGGGAYAAAQINGKLLKNRSVAGKKLRKNTVTGVELNEARLGPVPSADALSRVDYESASVGLPGGNAIAKATATCPSGLVAVGGGGKVSDATNGNLVDTEPAGRNAWEADGFSSNAQTLTAYVVCVAAKATTP